MVLDGKSSQEYLVNGGSLKAPFLVLYFSYYILMTFLTMLSVVLLSMLMMLLYSSFKMLGLTFPSKLYWGTHIISVAKTASKKIGALIRSVKFLSPEVALYLYKCTICPFMEYCCHVWAGAPSCYLKLLFKLQKRIRRTVGPSLATSFEPLAHRRNVGSLTFFYRYYFGRCSSELAQLFPLPSSRGRSIHYSDTLHDFSVSIPRCYKDVYVNSFFPRTARLWNSLPMECFPLTYGLSSFKSRINRHLLTVGSF